MVTNSLGYCSEVALAMTVADYKAMISEAMSNNRNGEQICEFIKAGFRKQQDNFIWLYWDWVEWYTDDMENYPSPIFIDNFLETIDDYDFIRIGEDMDDTEIRLYSGHYLLQIERTIKFD